MDYPTTAKIDARAEELMREFIEHKNECYSHVRAESPELLQPDGSLDDRRIFEGWCIQKIAGLQVLLEYEMLRNQ